MEEDKKGCCGLHKVGKIGRAVIIGCAIFVILLVGFSFGAGFNRERGVRFNERSYGPEGGCGRQINRGGQRFDERQNIEGCRGMMGAGNISPTAGCNMERQLNQNDIQITPSNPATVNGVTATGTIILQ